MDKLGGNATEETAGPKALPLASLVVLDLSRVLSGPYCSMMLGDMGAEIWKVEPPQGDDSRGLVPPLIGEQSPYFMGLNRNKRDICLDLSRPEGTAALLRLAAQADVVIENFRPDQKFRLGIDYDTIAKINPGVVYCSISGFGQTGPYRELPGLDNIFQGMAGLMAATGEAGSAPTKTGERIADVLAGVNAAFGIMTALFHREKTGEGQYLEIALVDCLIAAQAPLISYYFATGRQPPKAGNGSVFSAPTGTFDTATRSINLCVMNEKHWKKLCELLGCPEWLTDVRFKNNADRVNNSSALDALIVPVLQAQSAENWIERMREAGIPCGLSYEYAEVFSDPQVLHNDMLCELPHPTIGVQKTIGLPIRLHKTPGQLRRAAPLLGQHSQEILQDAGFSHEEIGQLVDLGVVKTLRRM